MKINLLSALYWQMVQVEIFKYRTIYQNETSMFFDSHITAEIELLNTDGN